MTNEMNNELKFNDAAVSVVEVIGENMKSRTQSIKVIVIEKDGQKFVSLQKWWRKSADEPWQEGKGFHFNTSEAKDIASYLNNAEKML